MVRLKANLVLYLASEHLFVLFHHVRLLKKKSELVENGLKIVKGQTRQNDENVVC